MPGAALLPLLTGDELIKPSSVNVGVITRNNFQTSLTLFEMLFMDHVFGERPTSLAIDINIISVQWLAASPNTVATQVQSQGLAYRQFRFMPKMEVHTCYNNPKLTAASV